MIKYMFINVNWEKIKYQIGNRYKSIKDKFIFHDNIYDINDINDINEYILTRSNDFKIFKIKRYKDSFKILNEINYSEIIPNKTSLKMIAAIKNKNEKILEEFIKSDSDDLQTVAINAGVHKYLDILIDTKGIYFASDIINRYGRNKDLDYFIENTKDFFTLSCIANVGRNKDLDKLINCGMNEVIQSGRKKDIEKYLLDENFHYTILRTKIDEYLDYFTMSDLSYSLKIHIIDIGRKKDLDLFINDKMDSIKHEIICHGYDEHLDILIQENNSYLDEKIMTFKRPCDVEVFKKRYENFDEEKFYLKE